MEYSYVSRNLSRCIKYKDLIGNTQLTNGLERKRLSANAAVLVDDSSVFNNSMSKITIAGKPAYIVKNIERSLILRLLSRNISTVYKLKPSNRDNIISLLIAFLKESSSYQVHRFDIQSFYESIDRKIIFNKIKNDGSLSKKNLAILSLWFKELEGKGVEGLPRGIGLSATISELVLKEVDEAIKLSKNVFYYDRFVDDIIIITNYSIKHEEIKVLLKSHLPHPKIKIHEKGDKIYSVQIAKPDDKKIEKNESFSYLGYKFNILEKNSSSDLVLGFKRRKVEIDISNDKLVKIKKRILMSFLSYTTNGQRTDIDYQLLLKRLKFLTGNYKLVHASRVQSVKSGIFYNYKYINKEAQLIKLDQYIKALLFSSKNKTFKRIQRVIPINKRRELAHFCFQKGHENKLFYKFAYADFNDIKRVW